MRDNGTDPQRKILSEIYKTSSTSAIIPAWIVAVFEVFFLINTCANPRYSTEHLVHYRFLYAFLLITTLLYIGLNSYIKENFEKRFPVLNVANPAITLFSFLWAIGISWLDSVESGAVDPILYMAITLAAPISFYMDQLIYCAITVSCDLLFLYIYMLRLQLSGAPMTITIPYLIIFFSIQIIMGFHILSLKKHLSERILDTSLQKDEIEDLSKAQNHFFASISHEIRTPINTIIGLDEMILRSNISDEVREDAENIQSAGKILLHLLNDLLDLSKIASGMMELTKAPYRTKEMFSEIYGMLKIRAQEKGLDFFVVLSPMIPERLLGDEVRIKQILINLINNAIKYTKDGCIKLYVDCAENNGIMDVIYTIEDTGMGIKDSSIPHLFTAYKRIDEDRTKYIEGTGLGLSIVKQLTTLMGGDIDVSSVYGKGSRFAVLIPQPIVDSTPIGDFDVTSPLLKENSDVYYSSIEAPGADVLIVDDTPANIVVAKKLLRDTKVNIDTAQGGEEALSKTLNKHYDVIFMDHFMPGMDGVECAGKIRVQADGKCRENTKIVVLTANVAPENEAFYIKSGFDGYLTKPITGRSIEEELKRQLPKDMVTETRKKTPENDGKDAELDSSIRQIFISSIDETAKKLEIYLSSEDIKNYTITIHGLKSTAHLAGEEELSQKAAILEEAGKNHDIEKIGRLHSSFMSDYVKYKGLESSRKAQKTKGAISKEDLKEAYMTITEYAQLKDYTLTQMLLNSLDEYELSTKDEKITTKLRGLMEKMDYDALFTYAKECYENIDKEEVDS